MYWMPSAPAESHASWLENSATPHSDDNEKGVENNINQYSKCK